MRRLTRLGKVHLLRWLVFALIVLCASAALAVALERPAFLFSEVSDEAGNVERQIKALPNLAAHSGAFVGAIVGAFGVVRGGVGRAASDAAVRIEELKEDLHLRTRVLFTDVAKQEDAPSWTELTVRTYCLDRLKPEVMTRVADVRHMDRPPSDIEWTKGKGCVGLAWRDGRATSINLARRKRLASLKSREKWDAADDDMKQGLSFDEAKRVQDCGYGAVVAHPIRDDGKVVGVVALDGPPGSYRSLRSPQVEAAVRRYITLATGSVAKLYHAYLD